MLSDNTVVATVGPVTTVRGYLGKSSDLVVTFTTSDGATATDLSITDGLNPLPSGWTSAVKSFTCASVSNGNACSLQLTFAPVAVGTGAVTLAFQYVAHNGASKTGSAGIAYTATQPSLKVLAGWIGGSGNLDGTGSGARFSSPSNVAVDNSGNIYVADTLNYEVRKIAPGGIVTTLAGSGTSALLDGTGPHAAFTAPGALAADSQGNVYLADGGTIRRISAAGVVSTIVGGSWAPGPAGTPQNLPGPAQGVAVDAADQLFVSTNTIDSTTQRTVASVAPNGAVQIVAGSAMEFQGTLGALSVDSAGNLYVVEEGAGIRSISPLGVVSTAAPYTAGYSAVGLAIDSSGSVLTSVPSNESIYQYSTSAGLSKFAGCDMAGCLGGWSDGGPGGTTLFSGGGGALFDDPTGLAFDRQGNLIVADTANSSIRAITPAGVVTTLAGAGMQRGTTDGTGAAARFDMALGVDSADHELCQVVCDNYSPSPGGLTADAAGNVFVADTGYGLVRKVTAAGVVTTLLFVPDTSGANCCVTYGPVCCALNGGIATDHVGNLYATVTLGDVQELIRPSAILKITPAGTATLVKDSSGKALIGGAGATYGSIALDSSGTLYVAAGTMILRVTSDGTATTWVGSATGGSIDGTGTQAKFGALAGIAVAPSGDVYAADAGNQTIREITAAGVVSTVAGKAGESGASDGPAAEARFSGPGPLAFDATGILYIGDTGSRTIRRLLPGATVDTLAGTVGRIGTAPGILPTTLDRPQGIAIRSDGQLVITVDSGVLATADL